MRNLICFEFFVLFAIPWLNALESKQGGLTILTVGKTLSDSLQRYFKTGKLNNLKIKLLGFDSSSPENLSSQLNYGDKINLLIHELRRGEYNEGDVILFTESHNFLFLASPEEILERFWTFQTEILLSADHGCIILQAPKNTIGCSDGGGLIGYKSKILSLLETLETAGKMEESIMREINKKINGKNKEKIKVDLKSKLFHNLNGVTSQIKQLKTNQGIYLKDIVLNTKILILHGHGQNRGTLNYYGNEVLNFEVNGHSPIMDHQINLKSELPTVTIGVFIERPTPFLEEFFDKIKSLEYPKEKISIFIANLIPYHEKLVNNFMTKHATEYKKLEMLSISINLGQDHVRMAGLTWAANSDMDFYLSIESNAHLDNPKTLKKLIEQNFNIVAPMLKNKLWPNFAMDYENSPGFYDKIQNYLDVVKDKRRGVWNVPFVTSVYLLKKNLIQNEALRPNFTSNFPQHFAPADVSFSWHNCKRGVFMFLSNQEDYGHLVNGVEFEKTLEKNRLQPELFEFFSNRQDWEGRYLHSNYSKFLESASPLTSPQACPDVYLFPALTQRFCDELIGEVEHFGNWSGFTVEEDDDPAPTSDISLHQIGMGELWFEFLRNYVQPLQQRVYPFYTSKTFVTDIPFVIRYEPDGRNILNPHLDESTYTINVALNTPGKDFEGGGVRFTRYNCSVTDNKPGWLLMHPGKLSHQHHGLVISKGRRYVLISFVDPPEFLGILNKSKDSNANSKKH